MFSRRRAYNRFRAVEATVSTSTALSKQASTESHTYDSCRSFNKSQRNIERRVSCAHCDHLQSTRTGQSVYAKSDNDGGWPSSRVISSRFFFSPSIESRSVRQSVTLVVWNWFDNLWPDSKAFHCVYLSSEHGTSTLESIEHPKNFRRKFFFFSFVVSLRFQFAISLPMRRVTNNYLGDHVWTWCHRPSVSCANAEPIEFHAAISSVALTWPPTLPRLRHESTYVFTHRALVSTLFLFLLSFSLPPPLF